MRDQIRPISGFEGAATCWGVAALVGVGAMALLFLIGGWTVVQSVFAGLVIAGALGVLLMLTVGRRLPHPAETRRVA